MEKQWGPGDLWVLCSEKNPGEWGGGGARADYGRKHGLRKGGEGGGRGGPGRAWISVLRMSKTLGRSVFGKKGPMY